MSRRQEIAAGLATIGTGLALMVAGLMVIFIAFGLALPRDAAAALLRGLW